MNKQQTVSHGLLYGIAPSQFTQLNISDNPFECNESESQFSGKSLANYLLAIQKEIAVK